MEISKKEKYNYGFETSNLGFLNSEDTIGFCNVNKPEVYKKYSFERINIKYLKKVIILLENMDFKEIDIGIAKNNCMPVIFKQNKEHKSGVVLMIAPIDNEVD